MNKNALHGGDKVIKSILPANRGFDLEIMKKIP
jgi:hypothetical protein